MVKKLAIDWDENELRLVAAQCSGSTVKVTDVAVIPLGEAGIAETLRTTISQRGHQSTETLVAIGRGQAELRELQLPPVPEEELPDMVRFQAIRSFASSGERATVDYLVTKRDDRGAEMIAAAVDPESLTEIQEMGASADLTIKRIGLRPLAAAALYLTKNGQGETGDTVLIDLLSDDAEIVVARDGHVVFVRTVRMPSGAAARPKALAGELRRSLVACGSSGPSLNRVILWGLESVHREDVDMLVEAAGTEVQVLDPFQIVEVDRKIRDELPEHVGRLAPLIGLLASDENHADRLIDFLNPRERVEEKPNQFKSAAMIGVPIAVVGLILFFGYRHLQNLDSKIAQLKTANAKMKPDVDLAIKQMAKTEKVDQFLDTNVNWLSEMRRLAVTMPPSDKMIVRSISASGNIQKGGGTLEVTGGVTDPDVIDLFEEKLRDETHRVGGDGSTQQNSGDAYRWTARESIIVAATSVRNDRYSGLAPVDADSADADSADADSADAESADAESEGDVGDEPTTEPEKNPPEKQITDPATLDAEDVTTEGDSESKATTPEEPDSESSESEGNDTNPDPTVLESAGPSKPETTETENPNLASEVKTEVPS